MSVVFDLIKTVYEVFDKRASQIQDKVDSASIAFREAMTETEIYLARAKESRHRDRDLEANLARLWSKTATEARTHAPELSQTCLDLSRYWANPWDNPLETSKKTLDFIHLEFSRAREDEELEE